MTRFTLTLIAAVVNAIAPDLGLAQSKHYALESTAGLRLPNIIAKPVTHKGKKGLRVEAGPGVVLGQAKPLLASIEGVEFSDGVIEAEIAGTPPPGVEGARGFVGIAFRVQPDNTTYDAFYLRPTNGRAEDQERRNHATQYISHPDWTWSRLRQETPSRYESYVDLEPDTWTKIRIEVRGTHARLYVHDQKQPALIVNDVKSGANAKGAVALWLEPGTVAHFRNLKVTPQPARLELK
jgi:hypothetical protein